MNNLKEMTQEQYDLYNRNKMRISRHKKFPSKYPYLKEVKLDTSEEEVQAFKKEYNKYKYKTKNQLKLERLKRKELKKQARIEEKERKYQEKLVQNEKKTIERLERENRILKTFQERERVKGLRKQRREEIKVKKQEIESIKHKYTLLGV